MRLLLSVVPAQQLISLSKIPTSGRQNLYHYTDLLGLQKILKAKCIAQVKDFDDFGVAHISKGDVSFTRDKRYTYKAVRDGAICFVFDQDKLKRKGYKITPFSFSFRDDSLHGRYESEEVVAGPVFLKDGLLETVISVKTRDKIKESISRLVERISNLGKLRKYIERDHWCREAFDLYGNKSDDLLWARQNARYEADHSWRPAFWWKTSKCDEAQASAQELIDEWETILAQVRVGNVS